MKHLSKSIITVDTQQKAMRHLKKSDPVLGKIVDIVGIIEWRFSNDYFVDLVESIVGQQLSGKAAATIFNRFSNILHNDIKAETILATPDEKLRESGTSWSKISYIKNLARASKEKELAFERFDQMEDEEIITELVKVKGIGQWTAEMFLMFTMGRPDVFSYGDLGLRRAMQRLYELKKEPMKEEAEKIAEKWQPYRTIACRYLWRSLEL